LAVVACGGSDTDSVFKASGGEGGDQPATGISLQELPDKYADVFC